jgi:hypothetical protein
VDLCGGNGTSDIIFIVLKYCVVLGNCALTVQMIFFTDSKIIS